MLALLLVLTAFPSHEPAIDNVDLIEVNHLYDQQGRHVIDQLIFWQWHQPDGAFRVRAWRLIKDQTCLPQRNRQGDYVCHWRDVNMLRKVVGARKRETWTTYDPEVADRDHLASDLRRELSK